MKLLKFTHVIHKKFETFCGLWILQHSFCKQNQKLQSFKFHITILHTYKVIVIEDPPSPTPSM